MTTTPPDIDLPHHYWPISVDGKAAIHVLTICHDRDKWLEFIEKKFPSSDYFKVMTASYGFAQAAIFTEKPRITTPPESATPEMPLEEALEKADLYSGRYKDVPSTSRTLAAAVRQLREQVTQKTADAERFLCAIQKIRAAFGLPRDNQDDLEEVARRKTAEVEALELICCNGVRVIRELEEENTQLNQSLSDSESRCIKMQKENAQLEENIKVVRRLAAEDATALQDKNTKLKQELEELRMAWSNRSPYVDESGIVSLSLQHAAVLTKILAVDSLTTRDIQEGARSMHDALRDLFRQAYLAKENSSHLTSDAMSDAMLNAGKFLIGDAR